MNQFSNILQGVGIGSSVFGTFTIDYGISDTSSNTELGTYDSSNFTLDISIGNHNFSSLENATNTVNVTTGNSEDFVVMLLSPEPSDDLSIFHFTFYDPNGLTLESDSIPESSEVFESFPSVDLFLSSSSSSDFGHYIFDLSIEATEPVSVPEPAQSMLLSIGCIIGIYRRKRVCPS